MQGNLSSSLSVGDNPTSFITTLDIPHQSNFNWYSSGVPYPALSTLLSQSFCSLTTKSSSILDKKNIDLAFSMTIVNTLSNPSPSINAIDELSCLVA